jgi:hypothetical protein
MTEAAQWKKKKKKNPAFVIEVPVSHQESEWSYICALEVIDFVSVPAIFQFYCGTVPTL